RRLLVIGGCAVAGWIGAVAFTGGAADAATPGSVTAGLTGLSQSIGQVTQTALPARPHPAPRPATIVVHRATTHPVGDQLHQPDPVAAPLVPLTEAAPKIAKVDPKLAAKPIAHAIKALTGRLQPATDQVTKQVTKQVAAPIADRVSTPVVND